MRKEMREPTKMNQLIIIIIRKIKLDICVFPRGWEGEKQRGQNKY